MRIRPVVPQGSGHIKQFIGLLDDGKAEVPDTIGEIVQLHLDQIDLLRGNIQMPTRKLKDARQENAVMRCLCTVTVDAVRALICLAKRNGKRSGLSDPGKEID